MAPTITSTYSARQQRTPPSTPRILTTGYSGERGTPLTLNNLVRNLFPKKWQRSWRTLVRSMTVPSFRPKTNIGSSRIPLVYQNQGARWHLEGRSRGRPRNGDVHG